ncbi:peptidoglycan-binding domain-containing protein [Shewanella marina]|uniref:peptidoglycan-binding domain-containing protein n=1 Tax=Shewanella marina TaxID=487319 RepID=UPI000ADFA7A6|nr:peptidoglycan-binding domain-containing protein [Shewanella marina]
MMKSHLTLTKVGIFVLSSLALSACTSTADFDHEKAQLKQQEQDLMLREKAFAEQQAKAAANAANADKTVESPLLPPHAKPGECYARLWVDPVYRTRSEQVLAKSASTHVEVLPAKYETVQEQVLVSEASSKLIPIPAKYGTKQERVLVSESHRSWHIRPDMTSPKASQDLLDKAQQYGVNLDGTRPGTCYHEHFRPAKYGHEDEQVLLSEASETITTTPAKYRMVDKRVLVKEASSRLVEIPAEFETVSEQVIDKPAHQIWKKGKGPIQRIDSSTGEIMCLVDVPATYKTITKRVLKTPATTREIEIPAVYKTVKVQEQIAAPKETRTTIPAKYGSVSKQVKLSDGEFVWHEVHDRSLSKHSRTGNEICLVEVPAKYKTVNVKTVMTPASYKTVDIPAAYKTVSVQKLVTPAKELTTDIPAQYKTVTSEELVKEGYMEWRSILCETNMTRSRIMDIQRALQSRGYNPGKIDGVVGVDTMMAVNKFQRDNDLPVDELLNIATIKKLGVSPK